MISNVIIVAICVVVYAIIAGCSQDIIFHDMDELGTELFYGNFIEFMSGVLPMMFWPITFLYLGIKWIIKKLENERYTDTKR